MHMCIKRNVIEEKRLEKQAEVSLCWSCGSDEGLWIRLIFGRKPMEDFKQENNMI